MMKKIFLLFTCLGLMNVGFSQLQKSDVEAIFTKIDFSSFEKVYITFNTSEAGAKHNMRDENLASYEALDPKTITVEYADNYIHLSGSSYDVFIPYDKIKYIHTTKGKSIQIKLSK